MDHDQESYKCPVYSNILSPSPFTLLKMSSSLSDFSAANAGDYYGYMIPLSSRVNAISFGKESDRKMWTIGRGEFNAVVLPSPAISLHHATITCESDKNFALMYIEDLSTNGVWINGERIAKETRTLLKDGCAVHFGQLLAHNDETRDFRFTFRLNSAIASSPSFSGSRIPELNKDYDVVQEIGAGSICKVLMAIERVTNECVAIKLYNRAKKSQQDAMDRERLLLQHLLEHDNLCGYKRASLETTGSSIGYVVFEYIDGKNLRTFMTERKNTSIGEDEVKHLILQICKAVQHLQDPNKRRPGAPRAILGAITHTDLKPENILLTSDLAPTVKVADFNAVIFAGETLRDVRGAMDYTAPEMAHPETVDHRIDNYSIGVLAFELLTGSLPYVNETHPPSTAEARIASRVMKDLKTSLRDRSPEALDFIKKLLEPEVGKRMSMNEAIDSHPWLWGVGRSARSKGKQRVVYDDDDVDMRPASPIKGSVPTNSSRRR
ncbi:kinase-like protein [Peniophora sp. CONT]|nr:kinase-like protein [Peniophora sp. CONT]